MLRRAVNWMLRGGFAGSASNHVAGPEGSQPDGTARRLVRDPVCGVHVAEVLSIPLRDGDELVHFCSVACRDRYMASTKKFVANAS